MKHSKLLVIRINPDRQLNLPNQSYYFLSNRESNYDSEYWKAVRGSTQYITQKYDKSYLFSGDGFSAQGRRCLVVEEEGLELQDRSERPARVQGLPLKHLFLRWLFYPHPLQHLYLKQNFFTYYIIIFFK